MLQFKNDKALIAFAVVLVGATAALIWHGDVTWKEGAAFIMGALALPGLFGKKGDDDKTPPAPPATPLLVLVVCIALAASSSGCALFTPKNIRSLLDATQTACLIVHADLADSDAAKVCDVTDALLPDARSILASSRQVSAKHAADASARAGAARCVASTDGSTAGAVPDRESEPGEPHSGFRKRFLGRAGFDGGVEAGR